MTEKHTPEPRKFDNKTLTLGATALVACSNLLTNDTWRKIGASAAPCLAIFLAYIVKKCKIALYMYIEQRKGREVYSSIIADLNGKLSSTQSVKEKTALRKDILKYEKDLNELKVKNIKSFI